MSHKEDSRFVYKTLIELGVSQRGLALMMNCSNVVNPWFRGKKLIPSYFRRFMLALLFMRRKGLLEEFLKFAKDEETKKYGRTRDDN